MADTETQWVAPYIAFRTLLDLIERMARVDPPPMIDKSYLQNYSGGYQSQILAALTGLNLIAEDGTVEQSLRDLVSADEAERKRLMRGIVEEFFSDAVALSKVNGTTKQLEDLFAAKYGLTGNTKAKGINFYLKASEWSGVQTSPNFRTPKTTPTGAKKRRQTPAPPNPENDTNNPPPPRRGMTYKVNLDSGGEVELSVDANLFSLSERDRSFVFGLVDWVQRFERGEEVSDEEG